jgi:hypothetical protein
MKREAGAAKPGIRTASILGGILVLATLALSVPERPTPPAPVVLTLPLPTVQSPFEEALYQARFYRLRAKAAAKHAMELNDAALPGAGDTDREAWRRTLMTGAPQRALGRAVAEARRATALARTVAEQSRAATVRVMIECEAGHHREELRQARRLVAIERGSGHALRVLLRAARCNGEDALAHRCVARLEATSESSVPGREVHR